MKLAIVIFNWNGVEMLKTYLPSVVDYSREDNVQIYVADNASVDNSVKWVRSSYPLVRLILLTENYGFAGGYNRALKEISSDYYLLLNSDVRVTPHWLRPLIGYMDKHSEVAACQPKLMSMKNTSSFEYAGACGGFIDYLGYPFCRGRIFNTIELDKGQYNTPLHVFWATGAALMIRSVDYWNAGGLDDRFFAHMEEIDLCWRLRRLNREIVCIPSSTVYHVGAATLKKENPRKTLLNFRNNLLMLYKNLPENELRSVLFIRSILDFVAAIFFALKGNIGNSSAIFKAHREFRMMKPSFSSDRSLLLSKSRLEDIPERVRGSILYSYYIQRRKKFSDLIRKK